MDVKFVNYDENYCNLSWTWLNDPVIKKMTSAHDFTRGEQIDWFKSIKSRNDYLIWGIQCDGNPIGAVGLKNINYCTKTGEFFGYIGNKEYWGMGIGKSMINHIENIAKNINLGMLCLFVEKYNNIAIKLYLSQGFQIIDNNSEKLYLTKKLIV